MSGSHSPHTIGPAGRLSSPLHKLDPRAKLIGVVAITITAVSAPPEEWPVYLACVALLVIAAAVAGLGPRLIARRSAVAAPFLLAIAILPLVRDGGETWALGFLTVHETGLLVAAGVAAKASIGVFAMVILGGTTSFPEVIHGLERLGVPKLLTQIAMFGYRYAFVCSDEVSRMRTALASRGFAPRHTLQSGAVGRVVAALFLRSFSRGERVHRAMLSRGYAGTIHRAETLSLGAAEVIAVAALVASLVAMRVAVGL